MDSLLNFDQGFISRLLVNTLSIIILVRFCYFSFNRNRAHSSAFILFGLGVFVVTALLHDADISMGFAFGLFAVFSMLRYRTESISVKEMTYLFLVIAISLLSAVADLAVKELLTVHILLISVAYLLETNVLMERLSEREIEYEKIENIRPENIQRLKNDIQKRTGWDIRQVDVMSVDFLKDTARIRVRYKPSLNVSEEMTQSNIERSY
jgi:hypothetical protein